MPLHQGSVEEAYLQGYLDELVLRFNRRRWRSRGLVFGRLPELAAGLQGAVFALVKAAIDRGTAQGTRKLTGIWPGDEGQQPGKPA